MEEQPILITEEWIRNNHFISFNEDGQLIYWYKYEEDFHIYLHPLTNPYDKNKPYYKIEVKAPREGYYGFCSTIEEYNRVVEFFYYH